MDLDFAPGPTIAEPISAAVNTASRIETLAEPNTVYVGAETYEAVNEMLHLVADDLGTDLWTLDALWWGAEKEHDPTKHFVRRTLPSAAAPKRSRPSAPAARPKKKSGPDTFVCQNCFQTKPVRLASDKPGWCIDCA